MKKSFRRTQLEVTGEGRSVGKEMELGWGVGVLRRHEDRNQRKGSVGYNGMVGCGRAGNG